MNMDAPKTTPKRYENTLVAILFLSWGTVFLDRMSQLYLAPYITPEFHLTHEQVGMLASVLAITWAVSTLFFGALSDRFGRRTILIPAVFAFSLLSWLSGVAHTFHQLLLIRALMGIAEGPCWSIMTALIEESSTPSAPRTQHRHRRQRRRARRPGRRADADHASRRALRLALGLLRLRRAGNSDGPADVEIRQGTATRKPTAGNGERLRITA